MPQLMPARPGDPLDAVETPALVVDRPALERNLARMAAILSSGGASGGAGVPRLRPHAKTHKSPDLARLQVAHGAVGVCCQKVGEAEAMVRGGVADVLVSNEIVGEGKLRRLAALAREARIGVCVDDAGNVEDLGAAARAAGVTIDVLVEIDVVTACGGAGRCGVAPGGPAQALARRVAATKGLRLRGLQAYHGSAQHVRDPAERRALAERSAAFAVETRDLLRRDGIEAAELCGGGTGTVGFDVARRGGLTELQAGSYVFMDADYARNAEPAEASRGANAAPFEQSLFVLATVMSAARPGHVVVDAGLKAFSTDSGLPLVADLAGATCTRASDEHCIVALAPGVPAPRVGARLKLVPGHIDPTVNLHDWLVLTEGDRVGALWPVAARGAVA